MALENLYVTFLNNDFSVNIASITVIFLGNNLKNAPEGIVSQNFDLGPSLFFMLCRNLINHFVPYYLCFMS